MSEYLTKYFDYVESAANIMLFEINVIKARIEGIQHDKLFEIFINRKNYSHRGDNSHTILNTRFDVFVLI